MLKIDLREINNNNLNDFIDLIPNYIKSNIEDGLFYVAGVDGAEYLEKISLNRIFDKIKIYIKELLPNMLRDIKGREILAINIEKINYNNHNFVDYITEIKIGTYQTSLASGTIYKKITLSKFDKEAQEIKFNNSISSFPEKIKSYYKEIFDEQTPVYRSFHFVNESVLESIQDGFIYEHNINEDYLWNLVRTLPI